MARTDFQGRDEALADLAAAQIAAGNRVLAMNIVRDIKDDARRAMALASVAGALRPLGGIGSAVPLFGPALPATKGGGSEECGRGKGWVRTGRIGGEA